MFFTFFYFFSKFKNVTLRIFELLHTFSRTLIRYRACHFL